MSELRFLIMQFHFHRSFDSLFGSSLADGDFKEFVRKVASILTFCYSEPLPIHAESSVVRDTKVKLIADLRERYKPNSTKRGNPFALKRALPRPGFYYPPLSLGKESLFFDRFEQGRNPWSSELILKRIRNKRFIYDTERYPDLRPTLQGFTELYDSALKGEVPNVELDGFLPIEYQRQPVVAGKPNPKVPNRGGGSLSAATQYFSEGLQMNQLLFLSNYRELTYESKSPSTSFAFLFRISHSRPDYCFMKIQGSGIIFDVYDWSGIMDKATLLLPISSTPWAQGDSVFLFHWGSTLSRIQCLNYAVEPRTINDPNP